MNLVREYFNFLILLIFVLVFSGCEKYLDEKPYQNLVVPSTLKDAQALLDDRKLIESDPGAGEVSSDDYYLTGDSYATLDEHLRRMYIWEKNNVFAPSFNDWRRLFDMTYIANTALETLEKIERVAGNENELDNVKGQALFARAWFHFQAALIWCKAYNQNTASAILGLPLRLNTNFNENSVRSNLGETYHQILEDLTLASELLPRAQMSVTRPSKAAAYGLLARVNLAMRSYSNAGDFANRALLLNDKLLNFSLLDSTVTYPIRQLNDEVVYESRMYAPIIIAYAKIDSNLYKSYDKNDLRKTLFFSLNDDGSPFYKGSYEGDIYPFTGISNNELYLIRAESYVRQGKLIEGINDLETLMINRWRVDPHTNTSLFKRPQSTDASIALEMILDERRRELLMRGLRWSDLKRLDEEGYEFNLKRKLEGKEYLMKNEPKFVLSIPEDIIGISGISQN